MVVSTRVCVCWEVARGGWECPSQQRFSQSDLALLLITLTSYRPPHIRLSCMEEPSVQRNLWSVVDLDPRFSDISGKGSRWLKRTNVLLPAEAGPQGLWDEHRALCFSAEGGERPGRMEHSLCPGKDFHQQRMRAQHGQLGYRPYVKLIFWVIFLTFFGGVPIEYNRNIPGYSWKEWSSFILNFALKDTPVKS